MTTYVPIVLQGIGWSHEHGHPLLLLRALGTDISFAVVSDADETRAFAACACMQGRTRRRWARLLAEVLQVAGISIDAIVLSPDEQGTLLATLRLRSPGGTHSFTVLGSDALLLAAETGVVPVMESSQLLALQRRLREPQGNGREETFTLPVEVEELIAQLERFPFSDDYGDSTS
jgi:bifunctional DNase/RNase